MKKELALAFPGIKFSVKSNRFAGGDSIDVVWVDGPTSAEVEAITRKYAAGSFDGMDDCYKYDRSAEAAAVREVLGDAMYVKERRDYSADALQSACDWYAEEYGKKFTVAGEAPFFYIAGADRQDDHWMFRLLGATNLCF